MCILRAVTDPILLTGANGHLGRLLIQALATDPDEPPVRAIVRSERAAKSLDDLPAPERPATGAPARIAASSALNAPSPMALSSVPSAPQLA